MCPFYPFHTIIIYALLLCPVWLLTYLVAAQGKELGVKYDFDKYQVIMHRSEEVGFNVTGIPIEFHDGGQLHVYSENSDLLIADKKIVLNSEGFDGNFLGNFSMVGNFLGKTSVRMRLKHKNTNETTLVGDPLPVTIIREERIIDHVFTASVATLVSLIYIHFGCALDWSYLKSTLKRPIGPVIGFIGQFLVMPLLSFGLGKVLFPDNAEMQLGMFFTGVSPAGGASNIWTCILEGNINLSITMTTISTFAAFGMMPLWIFTLGRHIFDSAKLGVPYQKITYFAVALVIPLGIGYIIQRYFPRLCKVCVRILKPFSTLLILFIVIFAIVTNLYLFQLFSWQIIVAGVGLPWIGYLLGMILAMIFKQHSDDVLAIAIETGVQNTGIAIFLLRFALPQPEGDLTTVVPVAVAIMTPFPLLGLYLYNKMRTRFSSKQKIIMVSDPADTTESPCLSNGDTIISTITVNNKL